MHSLAYLCLPRITVGMLNDLGTCFSAHMLDIVNNLVWVAHVAIINAISFALIDVMLDIVPHFLYTPPIQYVFILTVYLKEFFHEPVTNGRSFLRNVLNILLLWFSLSLYQ